MTEQWLATNSPASAAALEKTVNEHPATGLEVAADYMDAGLWQDGTTLLTHIVSATADKSKVSPLVYYYLAYFAGTDAPGGQGSNRMTSLRRKPPQTMCSPSRWR